MTYIIAFGIGRATKSKVGGCTEAEAQGISWQFVSVDMCDDDKVLGKSTSTFASMFQWQFDVCGPISNQFVRICECGMC